MRGHCQYCTEYSTLSTSWGRTLRSLNRAAAGEYDAEMVDSGNCTEEFEQPRPQRQMTGRSGVVPRELAMPKKLQCHSRGVGGRTEAHAISRVRGPRSSGPQHCRENLALSSNTPTVDRTA